MTQVDDDKVMVLMDGKDAPLSFPAPLLALQTLCPSRSRPRSALLLTLNLLSSSSVTNILNSALKALSLPSNRVSEAGDSGGEPSQRASIS